MAISKGHRFEVPLDVAFPGGLVLTGDVAADTEYQSYAYRSTGFRAAGAGASHGKVTAPKSAAPSGKAA